MKWFNRLKEKWGIDSNWRIIAILAVFALAGSSSLHVGHWLSGLFGVTKETPGYLKFLYWLLVFFPTYQTLVLLWSIPLLQFKFFWSRFKWLGTRLGRLVGIGRGKPSAAAALEPNEPAANESA